MVEGSREGLYDAATAFCEALVQTSSEEEKLGTDLSHLWNDTITSKRAKILLKSAQKVHDHKLDKQGQFGLLRRCNKYPFDPKLRKKKKYKKEIINFSKGDLSFNPCRCSWRALLNIYFTRPTI